MSPFLPFDEALAVAHSRCLASSTEWRAWCKEGMRPPNVPSGPDKTYKDSGWQGWGHWLGTGNTRNTTQFLPFGEALAVARSLRLANAFEWRELCKEGMRSPNVPSNPDKTYKDSGWQGWGHWLGTSNMPFAEALAVVRACGLASRFEWAEWCKAGMRPPNVPSNPNRTYKDAGWQGWDHWLGTGRTRPTTQCIPFAEALTVARSLNLANTKEWYAWCKEGRRPPNVPSNPAKVYKDDGWEGWGHWLGTGNQGCRRSSVPFLPFTEALAVARSLGLSTSTEWQAWSKGGERATNVPSNPNTFYKDNGWQGWGHWLGTGNQPTKATGLETATLNPDAAGSACLAANATAPGR